MKVFLLSTGTNGNTWCEIPEDDVDTWLNDGSVEEGDMVLYVYEETIHHVKKVTKFYLQKEVSS